VFKAGRWLIGAIAPLVVVLCATAAGAAPPSGTPDPSAIALTADDFVGAIDAGGEVGGATDTIVASYESGVEFLTPYGASKYAFLISSAFVARDAAAAGVEYSHLAHQLSARRTRTSFIKSYLAGAKLKPKDVVVTETTPRALRIADASMETGFVVYEKKTKTRTDVSLSAVALDRVLVLNIAVGLGNKVVAADAQAMASLVVQHAAKVLSPISVAFPEVSGTPQQGQTLSASVGTWGNAPGTYAYQWQDCDSVGATCTDIAGATGATYVVEPADVGRFLRVRVTATNRFGSTVIPSMVTGAAS
jgi:hypothetical protein